MRLYTFPVTFHQKNYQDIESWICFGFPVSNENNVLSLAGMPGGVGGLLSTGESYPDWRVIVSVSRRRPEDLHGGSALRELPRTSCRQR